MKMPDVVRRSVQQLLEQGGYDLVRTTLSTRASRVLQRCLVLAGPIRTVIDVGASDGRWSRDVMSLLPDAEYLLYEAASVHHPSLAKFASDHMNVHVRVAAASDHEGHVHFLSDPNNPLGGGASNIPHSTHDRLVTSERIDTAVTALELGPPYLLKLDAQGHESAILEGAKGVLSETALVWIEAYTVGGEDRMPIRDLLPFMGDRGFSLAGVADALVRPSDGLLWQADLQFLPSGHPSFSLTEFT